MTHKKKSNRGEYYRYYIENHHEPIVDRTLWNEVQRILQANAPNKTANARRYWCSGKVFCGLCGSLCVPLRKQQKTTAYQAWLCMETHQHGKAKECQNENGETLPLGCNALRVNDRVLQAAVHDILEQYVLADKSAYLTQMQAQIAQWCRKNSNSAKIIALQKQITALDEALDTLTEHLSQKRIPYERYLRVSERKEAELAKHKQSLHTLQSTLDNEQYTKRCTQEMQTIADLSDEAFFERITERIVLHPARRIELSLRGLPQPIFLQYQTLGRGKTYRAVFTVVPQE